MLNKEGAELLKKVIIKKYGKIEFEKITADENEFHLDFKIDQNIGENDMLNKQFKTTTEVTYMKSIIYTNWLF